MPEVTVGHTHFLSSVYQQKTKLQDHEAWLSSHVWSHNPFPFPASITGVIWASPTATTANFPLQFTPNCVRPFSKVAKQGCRWWPLSKQIRFGYRNTQTHTMLTALMVANTRHRPFKVSLEILFTPFSKLCLICYGVSWKIYARQTHSHARHSSKKTTCILLCILEVVCVFLSCHVLLLLVLVLLHEWTKVYYIMDYMHRHHAIMHLCEHVCVSKHLM